MTTQTEALKLALEALENTTPTGFNMESDKRFYAAITAIKEALAQPVFSHGKAEDLYVEMNKHLNCPHCGGSGHIDDVAQPEQCKYGQEPKSCTSSPMDCQCAIDATLAQPEQEYDWKDLYEKEKRRSAMWIAKYEEVAGPAPKAYPVAQPEQEPVAWRNAAIRVGEDLCSVGPFGYYDMTAEQWLDWALSVVTVHAPPAQRTWVGLTYDELIEIIDSFDYRYDVAKAIEAKLKEKNT